jgi:hypothetical protein
MKKILGVLVAMVCLLVFSNNSLAACDFGESWNSYTLSNANPSVSFQFPPGVVGRVK